MPANACDARDRETAAGCAILLEGLVEGVALAAVEGEHAPIRGDAGKRLRDDGLRNAGGLRIGRDVRNEGVEVAAAAGGEHWSGERERTEQDREAKAIHLWWVLADGSQFGEANSMSAGGTWGRVMVATRSTAGLKGCAGASAVDYRSIRCDAPAPRLACARPVHGP